MDAPSDELKGLATIPKPEIQAVLIEWGNLLGTLKIAYIRSTTSDFLAKATGLTLTAEEDAGENEVFGLDVYPTVREFLDGKVFEEALMVWFNDDGEALIADNVDFLGDNRRFRGTWEEVALKLFEMEKEMLSQIPEVPADLKQP